MPQTTSIYFDEELHLPLQPYLKISLKIDTILVPILCMAILKPY